MELEGSRRIRLGVVDANRVYVEAVASRLGAEPDLHVLRCAQDAAALREMLGHAAFDVVLGDAALFDPSWVVRPLDEAGAGPWLVLVGDHADRDVLVPAVRAGARGWVPRSATIDELLSAIRTTTAGGTWLRPEALTGVLDALVWSPPPEDPARTLLDTLTPREREVLSCLVEGLARPAVAARLRMSTNTVRTHVQSILAKLGVSSSLAAVAMARAASPAASVRAGR